MLVSDTSGLHVEVRLRPDAEVHPEVVKKHVEELLRQSQITFHSTLPFESITFLRENVSGIRICEESGILCFGGTCKPYFNADNVHIHIYQTRHTELCSVMDSEDDCDNVAISTTATTLPSPELDGLWESLVFENDILNRLLNYVTTATLFSDRCVDPHIISFNKVILLHGPPGTGKTSLCRALAQKLSIRLSERYSDVQLVEINSHSLFSKFFSESGKLVMRMFQSIKEMCENQDTFVCVLIDEVESLTAARKAALSGMEPSDAIRVVNALLTQIDGLKRLKNVLILTTSNITQAIDVAFVDRADLKIHVPLPSAFVIYAILQSALQELRRCGIVADSEDKFLDWREVKVYVQNDCMNTDDGATARLYYISQKCIGLSGRSIRRLPFIAHSAFLKYFTVSRCTGEIGGGGMSVQGIALSSGGRFFFTKYMTYTFRTILFLTIASIQIADCSVLTTNSTIVSLSSYPIARLTTSGVSSTIFAGDSVLLDASGSYLPNSSETYYYEFEFGDNSTAVTTTSTSVTHIFLSPGTFRVSLTVSDVLFSSSVSSTSSSYYSITKSGFPATSSTYYIYISPKLSCFPYQLSSSWIPSQQTLDLSVTVNDPGQPDAANLASQITSGFITSGPPPVAEIRNATLKYTVPLSPQTNSWSLSIPVSWMSWRSPVFLTLQSQITSIAGCSTRFSEFDATLQKQISYFGFPMTNVESDGSYPGIILKTSNYKPRYLRVRSNQCSKKTSMAIMGSSRSGDGLGGLVIVTGDFFKNFLLRDLSRDPTHGVNITSSLCGIISNCSDLQILDSLILNSGVLLITNRGLYMSSALPSKSSSSSSYVSFRQVLTGQSKIDSGISASIGLSLSAAVTSDCIQSEGSYIFVAYKTSTDTVPFGSLVYSSENSILSGSWSSIISSWDVSRVSGGGFIGFVRYQPSSANIYLVGVPTALCSGTSCANSAVVVAHYTTSLTTQILYTFPNTELVSGLALHANGLDMFVFGTGVWQSIDGGHNWFRIFSLSNYEAFCKFESALGRSSFGLLTNMNNIYYGRIGANSVVQIKSFNPPATSFVDIAMDGLGNLFGLYIQGNVTYSDLTSAYPTGFLNSISGDISSSYLKSVQIPTDSAINAADFSFPAHLVPVFVTADRVQFYSYSSLQSSYSLFKQHHIGLQLNHRSGGSALIKSVSPAGLVADCTIIDTLLSDDKSQTPALSQGLVVSITVNNGISATVSDSTTTSLVQIILDGTGTGTWQSSDVGKTIVVSFGSMVIDSITSSTTALAVLVRAPQVAATFPSGSWKVYDFRSGYDYANTGNQSISLSYSRNTSTISLSTGSLSLTSSHIGMFIVTTDGWGSILDVLSSNSFTASWFQNSSSSYGWGNWSIVDVVSPYVPGSFPLSIYRVRPWNITFSKCPWAIYTNRDLNYGQFISYKGNASYYTSLSIQDYATYPYFAQIKVRPILGNSALYSPSVSGQLDSMEKMSSTEVTAVDLGIGGRSSISVRPSVNSMLCSADAFQPLQLFEVCSPSRFLSLYKSISDFDFLYGQLTFLQSLPIMQILPINYRPPSSLGPWIPTSNNIYNADPSQPRYNNRYPISQNTGTFKQCLGKTDHAACGCTDSQRISLQVANSDCIDRVGKVLNDEAYVPNILIHDQGSSISNLSSRYTLTELNSRTDYCINAQSGLVCGSSQLYTVLLDPKANDSIQWISSSSELYHFRATVVEDEFCSNLTLEFAVYVVLATPGTGIILTYTSIASVLFGLLLLSAYFVYRRQVAAMNLAQ